MERKNERLTAILISQVIYPWFIIMIFLPIFWFQYNLDLAGVLLHNGSSSKFVLYSNTFLMLENWHHVSLFVTFFFYEVLVLILWTIFLREYLSCQYKCEVYFSIIYACMYRTKKNETYPLYDKFDCMTGHLHRFSIFIEKQWIKYICWRGISSILIDEKIEYYAFKTSELSLKLSYIE